MPDAANLRDSRSAPIFVREKISTGPFGCLRCSISHSIFCPAGMTCTRCVIDFGGALRWPTCTYFGDRTISSARRITSSGIVAEKSKVCRSEGIAQMIRRTSGQNPKSIKRTASSRTSSSMPLRSAFCWRM